MTQLVLMSHGEIAVAIRSAAFDILGPSDNVHALALRAGESPLTLEAALQALLLPFGPEPVIAICDIAGGTPGNVALKYALQHQGEISLFAGLNLPMVLAFMQQPGGYISPQKILKAGGDGMIDITARLRSLPTG